MADPGSFALDSFFDSRIIPRVPLSSPFAHPMKRLLLLLAILGVLAIHGAGEKVNLSRGKALLLTLPDSWTNAEVSALPPDVPGMATNVRFVTKNGSNDAVLITILPVADGRFSDQDSLKALVEQATEQFVAGSVEGKADIKEFKLGGASGFCATFTDANLVGQPSVKDDYKAMTSCFVYLGDQVMVTATVFTDDVAGKAYAEGMRILRSISLELPKNTL